MVHGGELPLPEGRLQPRCHLKGVFKHHPSLQQLLPRKLRVPEVLRCVHVEVRRKEELDTGLTEPLRVQEQVVLVQVDTAP